jgi:hypothetical protein
MPLNLHVLITYFMNVFNKRILECLNNIKGSGTFVSSRTAAFVFPGLEVDRVGELSYPINELQAKALINQAHKAPYGKGSETIVDNTVRSAWEIDAGMLKFKGNQWPTFLDRVLAAIKPDLGIENDEIAAHLYKMLIYEKGDFFLPHKDSEKEKGMFGTLVIGLPARHSGGELLVRFDGKEKIISFDSYSDNYEMPYTAFYADCDHEIRPLISGYRVCLVYNLVQLKSGRKIQLEPLEKHVVKLSELLKDDENNASLVPKIILLGHQYTPENFSKESLKLHDRTRAEVLLRAAAQAGYYANMCLVTSYVAGSPASGGYDYDDADENAEMEEVYDESLSIEHWLDDEVPPLRNIQFEDKDLLATFHLNDGEPIVKESTGYMGNYGPDLMHWYHYGAVMLWPKKMHERLILEQDAANQLEWIAYYSKKQSRLTASEMAVCEAILSGNLDSKTQDKTDYNVLVNWLIGMNDASCFDKFGYRLLQAHFLKIDTAHWAKLTDFYPTSNLEKLFQQIAQQGHVPVIAHLLAILQSIHGKSACSNLVDIQMRELPGYFSLLASIQGNNNPLITAQTLCAIFSLESRLPQNKEWVKTMASILTACNERSYVNTVLAQEIISLKSETALAYALLLTCRDDLQSRVNNKPQPPTDWSRPVPNAPKYAGQWKLLAEFLQSPVLQIYDYRKNQLERDMLENSIRHVDIDLVTETIKKGSPHTLRIIKTQAAYQRQLKQWNEDAALLKKVMPKIEAFASQSE